MQRITASLLTKREGEYMLLHEIQLNDLVQKEFQLSFQVYPILQAWLIHPCRSFIYIYVFYPSSGSGEDFETW